MSFQVTTAMVNQFNANVFHLSQQKGSRLAGLVRVESQKAESAFYDRIGSVSAQKKVGRHSETTYQDVPHSRRMIALEDYFFADLVDKEDKLRLIMSPESEYAKAAANALGRAKDDVIIAAALGSAYSGKAGATAVALPSTQKIVATDGATAGGTGLNVLTLRLVKKKFNKNEVDTQGLVMVVSAEQLDDLLGETTVTSSDYAAVKALVDGDVNSFMGFKFIRSERLPVLAGTVSFTVADGTYGSGAGTSTANSRRCFAFQKDGLLLAMAQDVMSKIEPLPTKHYSNQVYCSMGLGATRLEEEKVVEVLVRE